ncbi:MAG: hypothetical protein JF589_14225 [Gemmatimonadetes bacterium]|nr:hypothetical protein [Gemmatimonadota bacterium]
MRHTGMLLTICAALVATGCSGSSDRNEQRTRDEAPDGGVTLSRPNTAIREDTLAAGDIRIVTTNGGIDLALIGDSISSGLSPAALRKVKVETDTMKVNGSGFGSQIEKMVKGSVQSAIGTRVSFPISAVREVRYDGEKIVFDWNGKPRKVFEQTTIDHKPLLASFSPDDAKRFADAVNARNGKVKNK